MRRRTREEGKRAEDEKEEAYREKGNGGRWPCGTITAAATTVEPVAHMALE